MVILLLIQVIIGTREPLQKTQKAPFYEGKI